MQNLNSRILFETDTVANTFGLGETAPLLHLNQSMQVFPLQQHLSHMKQVFHLFATAPVASELETASLE